MHTDTTLAGNFLRKKKPQVGNINVHTTNLEAAYIITTTEHLNSLKPTASVQ